MNKPIKIILRIFACLFLILLLIYSGLCYYSWNNGSFIMAGTESGTEEYNNFDIYNYCKHRYVQLDKEPVNYPKYCKIKKGMTRKQVLQIMGIPPTTEDKDSMSWEKNGDLYIDISLSDTGTVVGKMRTFDGEHESPLRWYLFWLTPHKTAVTCC